MKWGLVGLLLLISTRSVQADSPELQKGDHISLIGNALADRMQHHGWLETLMQSRFPEHHLVFRNLGFSGDELTVRLRSAGFGSPDEWLTSNKTDVVFAFFGYNESFAGQKGLDKIKRDLDEFIKHTHDQKYNGKSPPHLVLFSPIAHENLHNRNLSDGRENNQRLKLYAQAMLYVQALAQVRGIKVGLVDLFTPTQEDDISNRDVMQREMQILDVMTANRDKRIWAIAQGKDLQVDDSNLPASIPVKTNKPGSGPGGTQLFLRGEEAIQQMHVAGGMKINLFASEEMFPELAKPVAMQFDISGRLWVAVWPTYPHWKPKQERNDKLLILEDTDGDGKADKCTIFADHLHCPTGFEFWGGGVLVAEAPDLLFLKDTSGSSRPPLRADFRERVLGGLDSADTHHTANSFVLDPGGALYFQEGVFHRTQVESPYAPPQRCADAGVYRYEPRTQKFEVYVSYPFANPHGHVFDRWGQDFVTDGTGNVNYYAPAFSGHVDYPRKHPEMHPIFNQRTRPSPDPSI